MNIITVLAYVFAPVATKSNDERTFHVLKIRYQQTKNNYIFADVYVSESQAKYLHEAKKNDQLIVSGEITVSAYINKEGAAAVKASIQAKSLKRINLNSPVEKKEPTISMPAVSTPTNSAQVAPGFGGKLAPAQAPHPEI